MNNLDLIPKYVLFSKETTENMIIYINSLHEVKNIVLVWYAVKSPN